MRQRKNKSVVVKPLYDIHDITVLPNNKKMKTDTRFQQRAKVGVAGEFFNQLMSNNATLPEVGKGATEMLYSDRRVYEVIEVSDDYKTVKLEVLDARIDPEYKKALKGGDCIGHQNWVFDATGQFITVVWRHNAWRVKGESITFTDEWYDKAEKAGKQSVSSILTDEQRAAVYGDDCRPSRVVEGITKKVTKYEKIRLLFGQKDYRYDWSF